MHQPAAGVAQLLPEDKDRRPSDASIRSLIDRLAPGWLASENTAAATELARLCGGTAARQRILKLNPVPTLVGMLARQNESVLEPCCSCLYKLAQEDSGRRIINAAGAVRPLVQALGSRRSAVVREACGALWNLGHRSEEGLKCMLSAKAVPALVRLLSQNDEQTILRSLGALANIATCAAGRQAIGAPASGAISAAVPLMHLGRGGNGGAVCRAAVRLLAHLTNGPRDRTSINIAGQLATAKAVPILVGLLATTTCRDDAASCLGNLGKEGKLKRHIIEAVAADEKKGGGAVSAAARLAMKPRNRSSVSRGPSWHPRAAPANGQRSSHLTNRPTTAPGGGRTAEKATRRLADGSIERPRSLLTSSVEMSGYWRERLAKEDMSAAELNQSVSHCRIGGRVASRQPRPWSIHMPDTSGSWGHVSTEGVAIDTL